MVCARVTRLRHTPNCIHICMVFPASAICRNYKAEFANISPECNGKRQPTQVPTSNRTSWGSFETARASMGHSSRHVGRSKWVRRNENITSTCSRGRASNKQSLFIVAELCSLKKKKKNRKFCVRVGPVSSTTTLISIKRSYYHTKIKPPRSDLCLRIQILLINNSNDNDQVLFIYK